jgi:hypothetical protein
MARRFAIVAGAVQMALAGQEPARTVQKSENFFHCS